jgi:hypothetical protein
VALRIDPARLREAALRYLGHDADAARHGPMSLARWLAEDRWEPWLPRAGAVVGPAGAALAALGLGEVPAEIRDAFLAVSDSGKVGSYVIPCGFEPGPPERRLAGRLVARTDTARRWLVGHRAVIEQFGLVVDVQERH